MPARGPEQAVLEHLEGAPARVRRWVPDLRTVEFLKQREVLGRRLYALRVEGDSEGHGRRALTLLVRAERVGGSWIARRMSGVSGPAEPEPGEPRVDLGGSWGRHGFCGGGRVHPGGADVSSVRLRFENGVELADDAEDGWVLFFTDEAVERPDATVELLDRDGEVVRSFRWPWAPDLVETLRRRLPTA